MSNGTALAKAPESEMEFVPFMAKDSIKLSVSIVQKLICVPTKSGAICNASQAMKFMMLCRARSLNPFEGDAYLVGYDTKDGPQFSLITAHQAFIKRAETHPEYDGMESGVIVRAADGEITDRQGDFFLDDDLLVGAWAVVYFKQRKYPMSKRIKLSTFRKSYGRWNDDPGGMIVKCAEADALRSSFPTMLGGMYLDDELGQVAIDMPQTKTFNVPASSKSDQLADRIASRNQINDELHYEPESSDPTGMTDPDPFRDEPPKQPAKKSTTKGVGANRGVMFDDPEPSGMATYPNE